MMQNIPSLQYGDLVIDLRSRTVALHGREITVTLKEFAVNPGCCSAASGSCLRRLI